MVQLAELTAALAPAGLNMVGVAEPAAWNRVALASRTTDALFPATRAIVVVGNGGPTLWRRFVADLEANPRHLLEEPNPLDAFARRAVLAADAAWGTTPRRWFFAAADAELHIDFRVAAQLAGLGAASRLGLLLHPEFGPWVGLRAACFVAADLPFASPMTDNPCAGCPAPCVSACPGRAFPGGSWSVDACGAFKSSSDRCTHHCFSRAACPVGSENRYDDAGFRYHNDRASGRRALREHLGIADGEDPFEGTGPYWGDWKARINATGRRDGA